MRLLVTTDAVGGVWTYALDLAEGLARRGDEVLLAVLGPAPSPAQRGSADGLPGVTLVELDLPLDWTADRPEALERSGAAVADLARRLDADLVHLNSPALAAGAAFRAPVAGVAHSCLATWWEAVEAGPPPRDLAWRIDATARGYALCDALIAPSAAFAAATRRAYGLTPLVVHNGRRPPAPTAAERDILVATAGRLWDRGKNVAALDAAAALLDAPILAIGPVRGPLGDGVNAPRLTHAGAKTPEEVAALLGRTQVFASAALYEPFGLAVLEAAQAGCALVLSDIPTFRELWDGAALFASPDDPAAFAEAAAALLSNAGARGRLARAGRARAERYGVNRFVAATAAVHRATLRGQARPEAAA